MLVRHRKKDGEPFLGCSNFPTCKGIKNMPKQAESTPEPAPSTEKKKPLTGAARRIAKLGKALGFKDADYVLAAQAVDRSVTTASGIRDMAEVDQEYLANQMQVKLQMREDRGKSTRNEIAIPE